MNKSADTLATALQVNGKPVELQAHPSSRLSDALRDELGLTGTKIGCHAGDCGACTVLLDGRQVCSCIVGVGQCAGRAVTTVEGLAAKDGQINTLQKAFHKHGAAQCGICTPGMLMAATDLLARNADPDEQQVLDAIGGVLCRCTGYRKIVEAVLAVAAGDVELAEPPAGRAVGSRAAKTDGIAKLTGAELYGADKAPAGSLWLRAVRSPHARAKFSFGDFKPLRARYPGLVDVITAADVPENSFGIFPDVKDQPVFAALTNAANTAAQGRVRFRGEAVCALVADHETLMRIRDEDVPIVWQPETALLNSDEALADTREPLHANNPDNVLVRGRVVKGDADKAVAAAAFVAEGAFTTSHVEHGYIEPEAGYAERVVENGVERMRIFASTQTPYMDRDEIARILKLKPAQVHIIPSAIGGGFGGKLDIAIQPMLAVAAWKLRRPVRGVYTRPESMVSTTKRHPAKMQVRFACDAQGRLLAADFQGDFNTGAYASWGNTVANRVPIHASGPYFVPHVKAMTRAVYTNNAIAGAFRGFGVPQSTIAHETLLDDLAEKVGMDRLEFRLLNAIRAGQATATGQVLKASAGLDQCLEALKPRWHQAQAECASFNQVAAKGGATKHLRRGVGVACMWYGCGNTVIANPSTMRAGLTRAGRIMFYNGAVDIGQGSNTTLLQVLADALGLRMSDIDFVMGDTDLTADAGKTSASRQAFVSGSASRLAGEQLRQRMLALVEARADAQLRFENGDLVAIDRDGEKRITLSELPCDDLGNVLSGEGTFNPPTVPLDKDGQGVPYATYAFAAQMAEVEVDIDLGTVKVLRIGAAHDVGRALNVTQVEGQVHGGVAQGLGLALMEDYQAGKTDNLHDYLIPTAGDIPPIDVFLIEDAEPLGPYGAKGVGEPALIATAPAIFGAIRHATGVVVRHAPVTPDKLRRLLLEKS
jgi:CO/xanthine dehydrogenase Mo-binding subunit/aerobic-type carbon monoxide dehydrogenase small subunit (CoxS/CutS family)